VPTIKENKRRKSSRKTGASPRIVRLELKDGMGRSRWITADLVDHTETGIGISVLAHLAVGVTVPVRGRFGVDQSEILLRTGVKWCQETDNGSFRAGLEFLDQPGAAPNGAAKDQPLDAPGPDELDYYEVMQLNPNADLDTITRVYRILAQRYHPDNTETGNPELFVRLCEAHNTLSDPVRRASYDVRHRQLKQLRWKIFDQPSAALGREAEKRKRSGILALLYAKTLRDPERAAMNIYEFEDLIGCPREHLDSALWYLRGKGYILRSDSGRFTITIPGFDEAESQAAAEPPVPHPQIPAHAG
jgi:hypothetical protein